MECADDCILFNPHDFAFRQGRRVSNALGLPSETSLAAKFIRPENCNHSLLAAFRNDRDFELALLDIKNRIRSVALREDCLALAVFGNRSPLANFGEEVFRIK